MVLNYLLAITFILCISFPTVIFANTCSRTKKGAGGISYVEYFCCRYFVEKNGECEACPNGYTSSGQTNICEPCLSGYHGERCAERCVCQGKESCDNVRGCVVTVQPTASMFKCLLGFTLNGTRCEQCPEGRYGEKCSAKCNCDSNERCDHVTGCVPMSSTEVNITHKPECLLGFTLNGTRCVQCPEGRYGEKCSAKCNCDSNERCDHVTGCVPMSSTEVNITHKPDEDLSDEKQGSGADIGIYLICIVVVLLVVIIFVIVWQS